MSQKKTPWFPASIKPVHEGEYEVDRQGIARMYPKKTRLLWSNGFWHHTKESCFDHVGAYAHMSGNDKWRGLAQKPRSK